VPVLSQLGRADGGGSVGSGDGVGSENELLQLYRDFLVLLRRCGRGSRPIDFASFSRRVSERRRLARERYGTDRLRMRVRISNGKPVIAICPIG
jgi:hypothetical protein